MNESESSFRLLASQHTKFSFFAKIHHLFAQDFFSRLLYNKDVKDGFFVNTKSR